MLSHPTQAQSPTGAEAAEGHGDGATPAELGAAMVMAQSAAAVAVARRASPSWAEVTLLVVLQLALRWRAVDWRMAAVDDVLALALGTAAEVLVDAAPRTRSLRALAALAAFSSLAAWAASSLERKKRTCIKTNHVKTNSKTELQTTKARRNNTTDRTHTLHELECSSATPRGMW